MAMFEAVGQDPLERTPVGMNFDSGLQFRVMRVSHICRSATNMGKEHTVFVLQCFKQITQRVYVCLNSTAIWQQSMRRTADSAAFMAEKDVVIPTDR